MRSQEGASGLRFHARVPSLVAILALQYKTRPMLARETTLANRLEFLNGKIWRMPS
jgi:hypothetical protein